jgi:PAS domain S-box-containing protein
MNLLSQRSTEATLRAVLARVALNPTRLLEILSASTEPLVAFTADRFVLAANPAAERLFGYGRHELDGRSTDVIVAERFRQPDAPPLVVTNDLMSIDLPALRRDGSELPLSWTFGSVRTATDPIFVMVVRDRVELDDALEALRASEERFRLLIDGVRDHALFILDADGFVSTWNSGAERIKGFSESEAIGRRYQDFFTEEDRKAGVPAAVLAAAAANGVAQANGYRVRKDGSRFEAESSVSRLLAREGALRGYAVGTYDLTDRMRAEENERRLHEERVARRAAEAAEKRAKVSEERLARLQRMTAALANAATPAEVAAIALRECVSMVGAAGGGAYMLSMDGRSLELLDESGHREGIEERLRVIPLTITTPMTDVARFGTPAFYESQQHWRAKYPGMPKGDGSFEASAVVPLMSRGTLVGVLGIRYRQVRVFDETERSVLLTIAEICSQALERARLFAAEQRARAEAESASRAKDEFLALLGHELRNPLAPIATALELMKLRSDERTMQERDVIQRQVRHMTKLVDDLLDVSRIARGMVELSREDVQVADVLSRAVEMVSPLLEQRGHQLTVNVPTPGLVVSADTARLSQVVANLLTNAAKYTPPPGHIHLQAAAEGTDVVIRVRDDGDGIGADLMPVIFDMFVQGRRTLARAEGGLGLGLSLVKNLVAMHGGTVSASSDGLGRGSEFVVRIPAVVARSVNARAATATPLPKGRSRCRVLVVDDNKDAAEMLAAGLRHFGYDVQLALDGPTALERLRTFDAEVALLDLGLPTIDGFELASRITSTYGDRRPRLVAVTGYGQDHDIIRGRNAGFDVHLIKPVELTVVIEAIESR